MKRKILSCLIICIISFLALDITGCSSSPEAQDDEIMLKIKLDLKEDIGLLILDCNLDGIETSGGVSNANKSLLKHNETLYWSFYRQEYENVSENADLTIRFRVITDYCDPNYDNNYPEDLTFLLEPITFKVDFGNVYNITVTGDNVNGYIAKLDD